MRRYQVTLIARAVHKHSSTVVLLLLLSFCIYAKAAYTKGSPSQEQQDWLAFLVGLALLALAAVDIRSGTATLVYSTFKRFEDPVGYWTAIGVSGCLGLAAVGFGLGQLVGLWTP
jgi:hypothetical protein